MSKERSRHIERAVEMLIERLADGVFILNFNGGEKAAPNEVGNFRCAQLDRNADHPVSSSFAMAPHAGGGRGDSVTCNAAIARRRGWGHFIFTDIVRLSFGAPCEMRALGYLVLLGLILLLLVDPSAIFIMLIAGWKLLELISPLIGIIIFAWLIMHIARGLSHFER